MREIVQTWAQQGAPNCSPLIEHEHSEIAWPTRTLRSQIFNVEGSRPVAFAEVEAVVSLLAFLFGDLLVKRLDALLAKEADDAQALSVSERQE